MTETALLRTPNYPGDHHREFINLLSRALRSAGTIGYFRLSTQAHDLVIKGFRDLYTITLC